MKSTRICSAILAVGLAATTVTAQSAKLADKDVAAIKAASDVFSKSVVAGDVAGVAKLYTETASFLPPNDKAVAGRAAIQAWMQNLPGEGVQAHAGRDRRPWGPRLREGHLHHDDASRRSAGTDRGRGQVRGDPPPPGRRVLADLPGHIQLGLAATALGRSSSTDLKARKGGARDR